MYVEIRLITVILTHTDRSSTSGEGTDEGEEERQLLENDSEHTDDDGETSSEEDNVESDELLNFYNRSVQSLPYSEQTAISSKILFVLFFLKDWKQQKEKVLIFSRFTNLFGILKDVIHDTGYKVFTLTGKNNQKCAFFLSEYFFLTLLLKSAQGKCDKFGVHDGPAVFLIGTKCGGSGLNLQCACKLLKLEPDWNPAVCLD